MNNMITFIILLAFISFLALLIVGMIIKSIPFIVSAFILGFVGYAITEHDNTNKTHTIV
jgi:uncharacterized membrane protein (DUF485 family)